MQLNKRYRVWFEIADQCNLCCAFCYRNGELQQESCSKQPGSNLSLAIVNKLVSEARVWLIGLTGGEPLLSTNFLPLVRHIGQLHIPLVLATNGTLLNREIVKTCIESGVVNFQIPILSASKYIHNMLVGRNVWDIVIEIVALIRDAGGYVTPVFVATNENLDEFLGVLEIAALFKISKVIFNRCKVRGECSPICVHSVPDRELKKVLLKANHVAGRYGITIVLGTPILFSQNEQAVLDSVELVSCSVTGRQHQFVVDLHGNVRGCLISRKVLGNLFQKDIESILRRSHSLYSHRSKVQGIRPCCLPLS